MHYLYILTIKYNLGWQFYCRFVRLYRLVLLVTLRIFFSWWCTKMKCVSSSSEFVVLLGASYWGRGWRGSFLQQFSWSFCLDHWPPTILWSSETPFSSWTGALLKFTRQSLQLRIYSIIVHVATTLHTRPTRISTLILRYSNSALISMIICSVSSIFN